MSFPLKKRSTRVPPSERTAHGLQGDSERARAEGRFGGTGCARYSAKRHSLFGECEIRWYHAERCVLWGEAVCVFLLLPSQGRHAYEFSGGYDSGNLRLAVGALLTFFSDKLCHREKNVPQMKLLGVALAVVGALMVFTV